MVSAGRLEGWIRRHPLQVRGLSFSRFAVNVFRQFNDVRVMGLAAEMTYYALLSMLPLTGALGASLGFFERLAGREQALAAEAAILRALEAVFSAEVTAEVITPLVQGLLRQERAGFALGSFLLSLFFASRIFRSAFDTLGAAYGVEERRGTLRLWLLGVVFALGAVLVVTVIVSMVVVGPLFGGGRAIANWVGLGPEFEAVWAMARWPVVFAVAVAFLSLLYRFGPNVRKTWLESLPGAVFGMAGLALVAVGFRYYLELTGLQSPHIEGADDAVALAAQLIGALIALLFWLWLSATAILLGGVVNAELSRMRAPAETSGAPADRSENR